MRVHMYKTKNYIALGVRRRGSQIRLVVVDQVAARFAKQGSPFNRYRREWTDIGVNKPIYRYRRK